MNVNTNGTTKEAPQEVVVSRTINAPRNLVFKAWTDPKHLSKWWGPHGFTNPVCEVDVRPGGAIRIDMRGPNGIVYPMTGAYREIAEPERLVFSSAALDANGIPLFDTLNTVTFTEQNGKTTISVTSLILNATPQGTGHLRGRAQGWSQSLERLESFSIQIGQGESASPTADREVIISRIFDAPRELVWRAMTDPQHVKFWWGPRGFSTTTQIMDVRPGGEWKHVMHGPDGASYPNHSIFKEVVPPQRIVYIHGGVKKDDPDAPNVSTEFTWSFDVVDGGQTKVTIHMVFPTAQDRDNVIKFYGAIEGGQQTLERLGEHLPSMMPITGPEFSITRVFNASREQVFKAFTEPDRLAQWWGPKGFTMLVAKLDLRPGGLFHYCMEAPPGHPMTGKMWGKFVYRQVVAPERIAFINSFSDENAGTTRHPMSPTWPLEVFNVLTLTEHEGKTTLNIRGHPINASETEIKTFAGGFDSMQKGFSGTFDQLEEYLAKN